MKLSDFIYYRDKVNWSEYEEILVDWLLDRVLNRDSKKDRFLEEIRIHKEVTEMKKVDLWNRLQYHTFDSKQSEVMSFLAGWIFKVDIFPLERHRVGAAKIIQRISRLSRCEMMWEYRKLVGYVRQYYIVKVSHNKMNRPLPRTVLTQMIYGDTDAYYSGPVEEFDTIGGHFILSGTDRTIIHQERPSLLPRKIDSIIWSSFPPRDGRYLFRHPTTRMFVRSTPENRYIETHQRNMALVFQEIRVRQILEQFH